MKSFDPTTLEIYRALYTSVAEEMGIALRRTAFSPNIKERRDYSCAVFDAEGGCRGVKRNRSATGRRRCLKRSFRRRHAFAGCDVGDGDLGGKGNREKGERGKER